MHAYLRAIGFSNIKNRKQLEKVYKEILHKPNRKIITNISSDTSLVQFEKDFGKNIGITLIGEFDIASGSLSIEYYFPYVKGILSNKVEPIYIEKHTDKEAFSGVSDDLKLGMSLIFFLQNIADYAKASSFKNESKELINVKVGALSTKGTILLPFSKTPNQKFFDELRKRVKNELLEAAKDGDMSAIENLTLDDMDTYAFISKKSQEEDVLSLVETSFMPSGVECEQYAIIGVIREVESINNVLSEELLYNLLVEVNEIFINICINSEDLLGEPVVGRRFKGNVWLQGHIVSL